jgi:hypothetical protein
MAKSTASYIPAIYKNSSKEASKNSSLSLVSSKEKLPTNITEHINSHIESSPVVIDHINSHVDSHMEKSSNIKDHINSHVDSYIDSSTSIKDYINSHIEKLVKPHFATFEHEDICPDYSGIIEELRVAIDNCVKKSGDTVLGTLSILKPPEANCDAVNKGYIDWFFCTLTQQIDSKFSKNSDMNINHYQIKNLQSPTDLNDAATKNYVDTKFENLSSYISIHHIFSRGQIIVNKTFFFNPGFICPYDIHIISVGFSTSLHKFNVQDKPRMIKLYFMVNQDIKSEYPIEKDIRVGYILKEFEEPVVFKKGDNFSMLVDCALQEASVNISFY